MIFERFEVPGLAHYSYLLGSTAAGRAVVVDPQRDVDAYLQRARALGLQISEVLETHIHADYASGARQLVHETGAEHRISAYDRGELYTAAYPHHPLHDGDTWEIADLRLRVLHTPGHTPEHLSFLIEDLGAEASPRLLSGDFLFFGSLGRPDLLGEDAKRQLAHALFDSVRGPLAALPDGVEVHPAHGAGSMCGAGMVERTASTLGLERRSNPYLDPLLSREEFVARILGQVPPFPDYYRRMKQLNADGPPLLDGLPGQRALTRDEFEERRSGGALVLDVRGASAYGEGHIPASFAIGAGNSLSTWASWVVPYERPLILLLEHPDQADPVVRSLVRVGFDEVVGYLEGGFETWRGGGGETATLPQITAAALHARREAGETLHVVDVRGDGEWQGGHIDGARHLMGGHLPARLDEIPDDGTPVILACAGGYRSTVAASVLERAGRRNLINLTGGMQAWASSGLPMVAD